MAPERALVLQSTGSIRYAMVARMDGGPVDVVWQSRTYNFGTVAIGEKATGVFAFFNSGGTPYYYNWYQPYNYYPGYFSYNNCYNYSYRYNYNNCYYGWYY